MGEWPRIIRDLLTETQKEVDKAYEADDSLDDDDKLMLDTLIGAAIATVEEGMDAGIEELEPLEGFLGSGEDDDEEDPKGR